MEQKHVKTIEGSPEPSDIFEPHMPGVELLSDMDELFNAARRLSATGEHPVGPGELSAGADAELEKYQGERSVVVVTPGRMLMPVPAPKPGTVRPSTEEAVRKLMPPDPPLNISVISYTYVGALLKDKRGAVPFLGLLVGFASIGHTVVVFEGHASAFESGVRGSDVLLMDSGMLPFIQSDWVEVAFKLMRSGARVLVHDRATYTLSALASNKDGIGWAPPKSENAEAIYADALLTLLVAGSRPSVRVASGEALPNLSDFMTPEQSARAFAPSLNYDELNADKVIDMILHAAGWRPYSLFKTGGTLPVNLSHDGRPASGSAA
jgi:hypothetical protein